jgi:hypothetical protein
MPEQGPTPEGEAKFTPAIDFSEAGPVNPEPFNEEPIELTAEEWALIAAPDSEESDEVSALMDTKGIPFDAVAKIKVGDQIYNMSTDRKDLGTWIE